MISYDETFGLLVKTQVNKIVKIYITQQLNEKYKKQNNNWKLIDFK